MCRHIKCAYVLQTFNGFIITITKDKLIFVASFKNVFKKTQTVFQDGPQEILKEFEAKILVDSSTEPNYCKAHTVPYSPHDKVDKELTRLANELKGMYTRTYWSCRQGFINCYSTETKQSQCYNLWGF